MKVEVFKCEVTGKLFESEIEYNSHLEMMAIEKEIKEKENELLANQETIKNSPRLTATSIEDFRQKVVDAVNQFDQIQKNKLVSLEFAKLHFGNIRNTHSAPIGGVLNFWENSDKPTSYLGWQGLLTITFAKERNHEDILELIQYFPAINMGSGGSITNYSNGKNKSNYVLEYDLRLFLQDFPLIKEQYDRYCELIKKEDVWREEIGVLCNEKNNSDEEIKELEKLQAEYNQKLAYLEIEIISLNHKIGDKRSKNFLDIHAANPFNEAKELASILTTFLR